MRKLILAFCAIVLTGCVSTYNDRFELNGKQYQCDIRVDRNEPSSKSAQIQHCVEIVYVPNG